MNNFVPARELDARKGSYSNIPNRGLRMSRMSIITGLLLLSTAACGRSTTSEQAAAEPTYPVEPSEPTEPAQPNEDSEEVVEGSSDPYYMGERRAPVIRHEVREEVRREDEVREDVEAEHRGEAAPVERGRR